MVETVFLKLENGVVRTIRFKQQGSTGTHFVNRDIEGEWHCDCMGFLTHKRCKHVEFGLNLWGRIKGLVRNE